MAVPPLRVLVVDDEPLARRGLLRQLAEHADVQVVGQAGDGRRALEALRSTACDLLLLDVEMPECDGLSVLRRLEPRERPAVVFVTAFAHYAVEAFEAHAQDYLLKPVDPERLARALQRVRDAREAGRDRARLEALLDELAARTPAEGRLAVQERGRTIMVDVADIERLEAAGNYVRVHARGRALLQRATLASLLDRLGPRGPCRIHRSHAVALGRVVELRSTARGDARVRLADDTWLPVSRRYRAALEDGLRG